MRHKSGPRGTASEKAVKDIRRATRKHYSAEEKIRIVLDGLRGEKTIGKRKRHQDRLRHKWRTAGATTFACGCDIENVVARFNRFAGVNSRFSEWSSSPISWAAQIAATARTAVKCWAASPGLRRRARMLSSRTGRPVIAARLNADRHLRHANHQ